MVTALFYFPPPPLCGYYKVKEKTSSEKMLLTIDELNLAWRCLFLWIIAQLDYFHTKLSSQTCMIRT